MLSFLKNFREKPWPFDQKRDVVALTTKQVVMDGLKILRVSHYLDDGSWAFTCGTTNNPKDALIVSMEEIINLDSSLFSIADLPLGWEAWRESVSSPWHRYSNTDG